MSSILLNIKLAKSNKTYCEGELIVGVVQVNCSTETKHEGISLTLDGAVTLHLSTKSIGVFEALYNSVKPIQLVNSTHDLSQPGRLLPGISEFHFKCPIVCQREPKTLYETYHGVFVNINYQLKCDIRRSFLAKSLQKTQQFCLQYKHKPSLHIPNVTQVTFTISPDTLQKSIKEKISIPRFLITGELNQTECCVTEPFTGSLTIQHTEVALKSIEVQLVRVETCGCAEGYSREATEIQNIQIVDGNVSPKIQIPIYMIFPRLFTCPTVISKNFKVEFEINLIIIFKDDYLVTENFQIVLKRSNSDIIGA